MKETQQNLQASLLDRLLDMEPKLSHETVQFRLVKFRQVERAIIRDLENLLNTRRNIMTPPASLQGVNRSLFVFGLRDFTGENPRNHSVKQRLRLEIENVISIFEPRLRNVTVQAEAPTRDERSLRFRINGLLVVEPLSEPVTFDTYFDVNRGEYFISK